jgi:hypothetical protein
MIRIANKKVMKIGAIRVIPPLVGLQFVLVVTTIFPQVPPVGVQWPGFPDAADPDSGAISDKPMLIIPQAGGITQTRCPSLKT